MTGKRRSLQASTAGIEKAITAITGKAWTREYLGERVSVSRDTIMKFFSGRAIDRRNFVQICEALELDWQEIIADIPPQPQQESVYNLDTLAQQLRQHCHDKIQLLYGKMQLLDIAQPVEVNNFYVEVNILEKITSQL